MSFEISTDISQNGKWNARKGNDNSVILSILQGLGAFNVAGYTFKFYLFRAGQDQSVLANALISLTQGSGITNGGATGLVTITLTKAQVAALVPEIYSMIVQVTHPDGTTHDWINGQWILNNDLWMGISTSSQVVTVNLGASTVEITLEPPGDTLDTATVDVTAAPITLDALNQKQRVFVGSATLASNKTIAMANDTPTLVFALHLRITGAVVLTLPAKFLMAGEARWNSGSKLLTLTGSTGTRFELSATYDAVNDEYKLKASPDAGYL